jgi:hypothetical protein
MLRVSLFSLSKTLLTPALETPSNLLLPSPPWLKVRQSAETELISGELRLVQTSLLGSVLSNLLLVLGMSFFAYVY